MAKSFYKKGFTERDNYVDVDTGEILSSNERSYGYIANSKEEFFLVYSSILGIFMNMTQSEIRVYSYLLRYSSGIDFAINKGLRVKIGDEVGINERTVYVTIDSLIKKNLIINMGDLYVINPRYAFRGSTKERDNKLKAIIELGYKDS